MKTLHSSSLFTLHSSLFVLILLLFVGCKGGGGGGSTGVISFFGGGAQGDWSIFRGDPALSGYTDIRLPRNPTLLWTFQSDSRTHSSPVVANGITYWSDRRGHIRGVDMNGNLVFEYNFQTAVEASPMIRDSILYIGRIDGNMSAISLNSGELLWNFETWGQLRASANFTNFGGREAIVFGSYDFYLYIVDSVTGEELNRFESGNYINGAVALWQNYVVFGGCDSWVRIIDSKTGIATDSLMVDNYIPNSPAIVDGFCYVVCYSGNLYEFQLENGKIVSHRIVLEGKANDVSVPAVTVESLFVLTNDQHLYSINRQDGSVNWRFLLKGEAHESSPVVSRDKVIVATRSGIVSIIDARTGTLEWEYDTGEQIVASPAVIRDRFYILTNRGTLFCFGR